MNSPAAFIKLPKPCKPCHSKTPVKNFTESGLTELSMTIRELRQLTANLNVIATRLERDPAGFVFSGKQGYTPK